MTETRPDRGMSGRRRAMVLRVDLAESLDQAILDWREDPEQTYELAVGLALSAARCTDDPAQAGAACSMRDLFGTLAQRIENYDGRDGQLEAEEAHVDIARALNDWETSERDDVASFAAQWLSRIGSIDVAWLDGALSAPLRSQGPFARLRRTKARRRIG